jgi:hypothetical protein
MSGGKIEKWKIELVEKFFDVKKEGGEGEAVAVHIINMVFDAAVDSAKKPEDASQARYACQDVRLKQGLVKADNPSLADISIREKQQQYVQQNPHRLP